MLPYKIVIFHEAIIDFDIAVDYYKSISINVAKKFYTSTNSTFKILQKNPFYQIRYDNFRLKLIKNFPYLIHYIIEEKEKTIYVYGIRHAHSNPETSYFKEK
jgi:toxin ParE1/3/4